MKAAVKSKLEIAAKNLREIGNQPTKSTAPAMKHLTHRDQATKSPSILLFGARPFRLPQPPFLVRALPDLCGTAGCLLAGRARTQFEAGSHIKFKTQPFMIENPYSPTPPAEVYRLEIKLTNLTKNDHAFLASIIAFFANPANDALADNIRSGAFGLKYNPETGLPNLCDLNPDAGLPPTAMIEFFARFTKKEWKRLKPHRSALIRHFLISRRSAELYVQRLLGYVPKPVKIKIFTE